jgi:hypothetical protein
MNKLNPRVFALVAFLVLAAAFLGSISSAWCGWRW